MTVEAVKAPVAQLAEVPAEVRQQATAAADQVREQFEHLGDKADTDLEKAALSLLLAEREFEFKTELPLVRYAAGEVITKAQKFKDLDGFSSVA